MTATLKPGRYRHFKGGEYSVHGVATHSETREQMVVYTPLSMFLETVERDGVTQPRFVCIE